VLFYRKDAKAQGVDYNGNKDLLNNLYQGIPKLVWFFPTSRVEKWYTEAIKPLFYHFCFTQSR